MCDVFGGRDSLNFQKICDLCTSGACVIRKNAETLYTLVEVMSYQSTLPCFQGNVPSIMSALKERTFCHVSEEDVGPMMKSIVERAYDHFGTKQYDQFQVYSNGIAR